MADRQVGRQAGKQAGRRRGTFGTRCTWVASHRRFAMGRIHKGEDAGRKRRREGDEGASESERANERERDRDRARARSCGGTLFM